VVRSLARGIGVITAGGTSVGWFFAGSLALLFVATTARADLIVENTWVRDAPPNAYMRAGYGTFRNDGPQAITITDVRSPDFDRAEVHETSFKNGMMTMRRVEKIVVAPGGRFDFSPNGNHVMLIAPKRAVHKGDKIEMEWVLTGGTVVKSVAEVRGAP